MDGGAWWAAVHGVRIERLHFHFSLSCIGEGIGNPLQCPGLENPRDGRASWAAVYGAAQSRTRLKRLSSSRTITSFAPPSNLMLTLFTETNKQEHSPPNPYKYPFIQMLLEATLLSHWFLQ